MRTAVPVVLLSLYFAGPVWGLPVAAVVLLVIRWAK
jgi:hypothetical protein